MSNCSIYSKDPLFNALKDKFGAEQGTAIFLNYQKKTGYKTGKMSITDINSFIDSKEEVNKEEIEVIDNDTPELNYQLKAVDILLSDKAKQVFKTLEKNKVTGDAFWSKVQKDLGIPKEQVELLKELNTYDREQLALELASNYSFTVEINTAKVPLGSIAENEERIDGAIEGENTKTYDYLSARNFENKSKYKKEDGWEYAELDITTPLISPSIESHAGFANKKNSIGWARVWYNKKTGTVEIQEIQSDLFQKGRDFAKLLTEEYIGKEYVTNEDLIKKLDSEVNPMYTAENSQMNPVYINNIAYSFDNKGWYSKKYSNVLKENQFLQLLNKDNNWVTFFIKSIIQDSTKKGYEKVLFPKGETAAKIEGHETIAEEIKRIDNELARFNDISKLSIKPYTKTSGIYNKQLEGIDVAYLGDEFFYKKDNFTNLTLDEAKTEFNRIKNNLEQEKANLKSQGIEKLKPIEAFYEIKVGNILEKQFGKDNIKTITDEFGNQWREIEIKPERDLSTIFLHKVNPNNIQLSSENIEQNNKVIDISSLLNKNVQPKSLLGIALTSENKEPVNKKGKPLTTLEEASRIQLSTLKQLFLDSGIKVEVILDATIQGSGQIEHNMYGTPVIRINPKLIQKDTVFHEFSHLFIELLGVENEYVQQAISELRGTLLWDDVASRYPELNEIDLGKEVLAHAMGKKGENIFTSKSQENKLKFYIRRIIRALADLFRTNISAVDTLVDKMVSAKDLKHTNKQLREFYAQHKSSSNKKIEDSLKSIENTINIQIAILKGKNKNKLYQDDIERKEHLLFQLKELKGIEGIFEFLKEAFEDTDRIFEEFQAVVNNEIEMTPGEKISIIHQAKENMAAYDILDEIQIMTEFNEADMTSEFGINLLTAINKRNKLKKLYLEESKPIIADWLLQEVDTETTEAFKKAVKRGREEMVLTKEVIIKQLEEAPSDIATHALWFDTLINSSDAVLALYKKNIKKQLYRAKLESIGYTNTMADAYNALVKAKGKKSNKDLFEAFVEIIPDRFRDKTEGRKLHKAFVQEIDYTKFYKEQDEFFDRLKTTYGEDFYNNPDVSDLRKSEIDAWYKENTVPTADANELWENLKHDYEQGLIPESVYNNFVDKNISLNDNNELVHFKGDLVEPNREKYKNARYTAIMEDADLKAFYETVVPAYVEKQKKLVSHRQLGYILPYKQKDASEQSVKEQIKDAVDGKIINKYSEKTNTELQTLAGKPYRQIKTKFLDYLAPEEVTDNVIMSVIEFGEMCDTFDALNESHGFAAVLRDLLETRKIQKRDSFGRIVTTGKSKEASHQDTSVKNNAYKALSEDIEAAFYDSEKEHIKVKIPLTNSELDVDNLLNRIMFLGSASALGGNLYQATNNIVVGNIMTFAEGAGGTLYSKKDWSKALVQYGNVLKNVVTDFGKTGNARSKDALLIEYLDAVQGSEFTDVTGKDITASIAKSMFTTNTIFFLQHCGEHQIQITSFLAALNKYKVKDAEGKEILNSKGVPMTLYEAYSKDKVTGKLILDPRVANFAEQDKFKLVTKIHSMNNYLHGVYNEFDKQSANRYVLGKLGLMFRKWIYSGFSRRFRKYQIDYAINDEIEGTYRTFFNFLAKDLIKEKGNILKAMKGMTEMEQANVRRTMVEISALVISVGLVTALVGGLSKAPDDDDAWGNAFVAYQSRRLISELTFFVNPVEMMRIFKTPTGMFGEVDAISDALYQLIFDPFGEYDTNSRYHEKGESKLAYKIQKPFKFFMNLEDWVSPEEKYQGFLSTYIK